MATHTQRQRAVPGQILPDPQRRGRWLFVPFGGVPVRLVLSRRLCADLAPYTVVMGVVAQDWPWPTPRCVAVWTRFSPLPRRSPGLWWRGWVSWPLLAALVIWLMPFTYGQWNFSPARHLTEDPPFVLALGGTGLVAFALAAWVARRSLRLQRRQQIRAAFEGDAAGQV